MAKNIIFYFTGTGNSLKVAKDIAESLDECTLTSMGKPYKLSGAYENIGFVYPVYFVGMPGAVKRFIETLDIRESKGAYFFAVCTSGRTPGGLGEIAKIVAGKGGKLSYATNIPCFPNYVCLYPMINKVKEKVASQVKLTKQVALDIQNKSVNKAPKNPLFAPANGIFVKSAANKDKDYNVSDSCNSCGTCSRVCPVGNIKMQNGKPSFQHHCEQCVACIQWCPQQAINYKNKTQSRGRYHHPDITLGDIIGE